VRRVANPCRGHLLPKPCCVRGHRARSSLSTARHAQHYAAAPAPAAASAPAATPGSRPSAAGGGSSAPTAAHPAPEAAARTLAPQQPATAAHGRERSPAADISFTATRGAGGGLLLGSSREDAGFDAAPCERVAAAILARGAAFLPQARAP